MGASQRPPPYPSQPPESAHSPRTHSSDMAEVPANRRAPPHPLSFQQVLRLLPLSAPRVWPLLMVPVAGSALLLPRTRSNSHRLRRFPITVSTSQQAGYWARQHGAIAGRKERLGLPPSTPPGIRASAWTEATRGAPPPSQSTHAQSTDPAPFLLPKHVGGGVSLRFSNRQE